MCCNRDTLEAQLAAADRHNKKLAFSIHAKPNARFVPLVRKPNNSLAGLKLLNNHACPGVFADPTDHGERLAAERRLLNTIVNSIPHALFWKDRQSNYLGCNDVFARLAGLNSSNDIKGLSDFDLPWSRAEAEFYRECDRKVMSGELEMVNLEEPQSGPNGEERILWTSKLPLQDEHGQVVGMVGIFSDVTEHRRAESERDRLSREMQELSRKAGMAEIASGVLHNVGNVLNSVNVSADALRERLHANPVQQLQEIVDVLRSQQNNLAEFLASEDRGQLLPEVMGQVANGLAGEFNALEAELAGLLENVGHIKEIVAMQQAYATYSGIREKLKCSDLIEDSIKISGVESKQRFRLIRDFQGCAEISTDRHKVLQILINLLSNAEHAIIDGATDAGEILVGLRQHEDLAHISISDNGIGIEPGHLEKLFVHGFTTRKRGHGFGLHHSSLSAQQLGGQLSAHSPGPGQGATFCLKLPVL